MLVIVALGGNALLRRGEPMDFEMQRRNVAAAADAVAEIAAQHRIVVTHGNGPQVGFLALQALALTGSSPAPLDVLDAESEGMIGYLIEQELGNRLPARNVATLLTRVAVDAADPAFATPTKPIGPIYAEREATQLTRGRGWAFAAEGAGFRRVVPSPLPRRILELAAIKTLVDAGMLVVCAGGGGIPVVVDEAGAMRGVEAVIDKDRAAALLAEGLGADALLLLTDVAAVWSAWRDENARALRLATPAALSQFEFDPGSMGPKVEAACRFVTQSGGFAGIGALTDAGAVLAGKAGTRICRDGPVEWYDPRDLPHPVW